MVVAATATTMHHAVQLILWLSPTVMESVIVVVMVHRKLWRDLPIFLSYLVFEIGRTVFLFIERKNQWMYFYGFWVTEAIGCLAALSVIKELFDNAFHRHLGLQRLGNVLFQWSLLLLVVTAVLMAWMSPGTDPNRVIAGIFIVKRTVTFIQAGLLGFLFLFALTFGLGWKHYVVGIALGFGIYGVVELAAIAARTAYGPVATGVLTWVMMTANNCCVLAWAAYFLSPTPARVTLVDDEIESVLEGWNDALLQLLRR